MEQDVTLVIDNVTVVTMDDARRVLSGAAIAVSGDRIEAVGHRPELTARHPNAKRLDGHGMVALPGLIDTHAHADQAVLRGVADNLHWIPFLRDVVYPLLGARTTKDVLASYRLSMLEMLRSGTTCFVDPNVQPHYDLAAIASAIEEAGARAILARCVAPDSEDQLRSAPFDLDSASTAVRAWSGAAGGRLQMALAPEVPRELEPTHDPQFLRRVRRAADDLGVSLVFHFASEREDAEFYQKTFGQHPVRYAQEHEILGRDVLLINACWLTDDEIELLTETGTPVAHTPSANMKMGSGIARVSDMLARGVTVALGTDGGANNNVHDLIREMKAASLLQNAVSGAGALRAEDALEMATIHGARAIGRQADLGSIEAGKLADIVLIDLDKPHSTPVFDVASSLVYCATGSDVDTVLVNGEIVVQDGHSTRLDENEIMDEARKEGAALLRRGQLRVDHAWPHG